MARILAELFLAGLVLIDGRVCKRSIVPESGKVLMQEACLFAGSSV